MSDNKVDIINRLIKIRTHLGLSSKDFASKAGIDASNYSSIEKGKRSFGERVMRDICNSFDINRDWLLTGRGEMLKGESEEPYLCEMANYVPLLPISAQGGSLNDFVVSVKNRDCEKVISPIKGADFAMTVAGDSMAPEYPNGSQILIKRINENIFIEWGKVYVLDTANGSVIKIVTKSEMDGCLHCTSINSDQKRYAPFDVPMDEIYGMFRVMLCMATK